MQIVRTEVLQQITPPFLLCAVAFGKILPRFAVRKIQTSSPGDQKFVAYGALSVAQENRRPGETRNLRSAQTGWSAAHDQHIRIRVGHRRL